MTRGATPDVRHHSTSQPEDPQSESRLPLQVVSFNRRYRMQDGTVQTSPGKADPAIIRGILRPAGPIDPDVGVVTFDEVGGTPLATLVNFAIHLDTIGGNQPSADFPFQISTLLASVRGPDMLTVFVVLRRLIV